MRLPIIDSYRSLTRKGVLGINRRNADYIMVYNKRSLYPLVDNKLETKRLAIQAGISVPKLLGVVESQRQVRDVPQFLANMTDFVIKPACGSGGDGILVFSGRQKERFRKINGQLLDDDELAFHVSNIISGMYSLGGHPDKAIIEERIVFSTVFEKITYQGVPDIRIITFLGIPVMAMMRLPTRLSEGKANLHQGAIGAGIHIHSGETITAVFQNDIVDEHPDTGERIAGLVIPDWPKLVELAASCYPLTGLGYIGVDIALDQNKGPVLLELNARPGLNIQIANHEPLLPRLAKAEAFLQANPGVSLAGKIEFALTHFS